MPRKVAIVVLSFLALATLTVGAALLCGCHPQAPETPLNTGIMDLVFLDDSTILLLTDEGEFVRSEDGGESWSIVCQVGDEECFVCPDGCDVYDLVPGEDGTVWARWATPRWVDDPRQKVTSRASGGVAFSPDTGSHFQLIPRSEFTAFLPGAPIPVPGNPPLWTSELDAQLWSHMPGAPFDAESFSPLGNPVPLDGDGYVTIVRGVYCGGEIVVGVIDSGSLELEIAPSNTFWSSADDGVEWSRDYEIAEGPDQSLMACGAGEDLWAIFARKILWYDCFTRSWRVITRVVDLLYFDAGPVMHVHDLTSDGDKLFVLASSHRTGRFVFSITPEGDLEELPPLPEEALTRWIEVRTGRNRELWAAGPGLLRYDDTRGEWERVWPRP